MVKKKAKKKAKKKSPLEKIKKELDKLEKLHDKENDVVEKINDIIDEEDNDGPRNPQGKDGPHVRAHGRSARSCGTS